MRTMIIIMMTVMTVMTMMMLMMKMTTHQEWLTQHQDSTCLGPVTLVLMIMLMLIMNHNLDP